MKITLLIPALNEFEGLRHCFQKMPREKFFQILVVDGGSADGSQQFLKENQIEFYVQKQKGIRAAYVEAWPLIRGDYVITFSPDGNCIIEDVDLIIDQLKAGYDLVLASRYLQNAKSEDDDQLTAFGNFLFTKIISIFFRIPLTDSMNIYRGYRSSLFNELNIQNSGIESFERILKTSVGVEPLITIRAAKAKLKIAEVPSSEPKRMFGQRKMLPFKWGALILSQIIRERFVR